MTLYDYQFSPTLDIVDAPHPSICLIIASTPRCGSHMLGHLLLKTGVFGAPFEYCNPINLTEWKKRLGTSGLTDTLAVLKARRTTRDGLFSIKLHYEHTLQFRSFSKLLQMFPNPCFVNLERSDLLAQAISYARAQQTGVWIEGQHGTGRAAVYDHNAIERCLGKIIAARAAWSYDLAAHGCRVLDVSYEHIIEDSAGAIADIAAFVGISLESLHTSNSLVTTKQSTPGEVNHWANRYLREANAGFSRLLYLSVQRSFHNSYLRRDCNKRDTRGSRFGILMKPIEGVVGAMMKRFGGSGGKGGSYR